MSFFGDLKDMHALKKKAEEMQAQMAQEKIEGTSKNGVYKVIMNGNQDILEVIVPEDNLVKEVIQKNIKEALEDAKKKLESIMRSKIMPF